MKKKLLSTVLAFCLLVGLIPITALAEDSTETVTYTLTYEYPEDKCTFTVKEWEDETITYTSGSAVPANKYLIHEIGNIADGYRIKSVTMNDEDRTEGFINGAYGGLATTIRADTHIKIELEQVPVELPSVKSATLYTDASFNNLAETNITYTASSTEERLYGKAVYSDGVNYPVYYATGQWEFTTDGTTWLPTATWGSNRFDFWPGWQGLDGNGHPELDFLTASYDIRLCVQPTDLYTTGNPVYSNVIHVNGGASTGTSHQHSWSTTWSSDASSHWHACAGCTEKTDVASHSFGEWTVTQAATETTAGSQYRDCTVCNYRETKSIPTTSHQHSWATAWSSDSSNHWHACTDCDEKADVAPHSFGDWTVTQEATSTTAGSRYHDCTVCGYRETQSIPATGGSSTGGSSTGGSSSGGSSGSSTSTTTTQNPDGSTTTTTENKATGTTTETTKNPDGSQTVVETKKDGTVTTTETDAVGNQTATTAAPDGSSVTTVTQKDGTTATASGQTAAEVTLSAAAVAAAQESAVSLPIAQVQAARSTETAPSVIVNTGSGQPVKVEIPVTDPTPGTVAILVNADGTEEVIKASVPTQDGLAVTLPDGATVKIVDNSKDFSDVSTGDWAADAIDFVSARGLFSGTSETTFAPDASMTRAMLMTVLARCDGADTNGGATWYEKSMEWAVANGISDGSDPNGNITREQLVTMLWRYTGSPAAAGDLSSFADAEQISGYAQEAMSWAVENGVISGFGGGQLGPQGQATRAQVAQILKNFMEKG